MLSRRLFVMLAGMTAATPSLALGTAPVGRIETVPKIGASGSPVPRIRVWLPADYAPGSRPHRTLYMLDGQFAFADDSEGVNFAADRRVAALMATGTIPPTLIVAIDHIEGDRFLQYMPQAIYDAGGAGVRGVVDREVRRVGKTALVSAPFIRFVAEELKLFVDARYGTSPDRRGTAIFGASMAGLAAGALFVEAPQVFGRAGCMSPNWPVYDARMIDLPGLPQVWADYFARLGPPAERRLWLDHGTQMMDAGMAPHQTAIANRLTDLGWQRGCDLQTRVYDAGHAFAQTATQMDEMLAWLLA